MQQQHLPRPSRKRFNDHYACAHAWAHQLYQEGYSSNFFFVGSTIYSYGHHFPIAVIEGNNVYFTQQSYSRSTAKHKGLALSAISHKNIVYVQYTPTSSAGLDTSFQKRNIDYWIDAIERTLSEYQGNPRKKSLLSRANAVLDRLTNFVLAVGVSPDSTLQPLLENPTLEALQQYKHQQLDQKRKAAQRKARQAIIRYKKDVKDWKAGKRKELFAYFGGIVDNNLAYLRLSDDQTIIETSKGIRLSIESCHKFWLFIQNTLQEHVKDFSYQIKGYDVTAITPEFITVGCHKIPMSEANDLAKQLDW